MPDNSPKSQARKAREERLAAELRENLRKRKAQGRVRRGTEAEPASPSAADVEWPVNGKPTAQ